MSPENYKIIYVKGRKTVGITVDSGGVTVRAPKGLSEKALQTVLADKKAWIDKKLASEREKYSINRAVIEYSEYLYLGKKYSTFADVWAIAAGRPLPEKKNTFKNVPKLYAKLAEEYLSARLGEISRATGLKYSSLRLINARTRWGSFDDKGAVSLNWRLILLEPYLIDYIIVHELCHQIYMDHSKNFWEAVADFLPDYKRAVKAVKEDNFVIKLFR